MKTPQQIEEMAKELLKHLAPNSYIDHGLSEFTLKDAIKSILFIKKDLLASASEGSDDCFSKYATESNLHHEFDAHYFWQACALSYEKKLQEKDAEIEKLKDKFEKQYRQGCSTQGDLNRANEDLFSLKSIETKYQEAMKDIDTLSKDHINYGSLEINEIRTKYGLDKKEG